MEFLRHTLPNGLEIVAECNSQAYSTALGFFVRAGARDEADETAGVSHFLEHMVFKGTKKYGVGEIANLVKSFGGNLNAGTSYSYTMYYIVLPSRAFAKALEIQAAYDLLEDDPSLYCEPASTARVWANPNVRIAFDQSDDRVLISYEFYDLRRDIPLALFSCLPSRQQIDRTRRGKHRI